MGCRDQVVELANAAGIYLVPVTSGRCRVEGDTADMPLECPCPQVATCPIAQAAVARGPVPLSEHAETPLD